MKTIRCLFLILHGLSGFLGQSARAEEPLRVLAAASLTEPLNALAEKFTRQSGIPIHPQFGGSGTLVRQIAGGAPADLFISADELRMDSLAKDGLLLPDTRRNLASNQLVLIVPSDSLLTELSPSDLATPSTRKLALGDPATVPVGTYSRDFLQSQDLWAKIERKVIPLPSVRAVLAAVESGNVQAGFVYRTDAVLSDQVRVTHVIPMSQGPVIVYPAAVLRSSRQPEAARRFLDYLASAEAFPVFASFGFAPPPEE